MFKGLFLSALCMLSCSAKAIEPSVDQIDSYEPTILEKREAVNTSYALYGCYNFKSQIIWDNSEREDGTYTLYFNNQDMFMTLSDNEFYILEYIRFTYDTFNSSLRLRINYHSDYDQYAYTFDIYSGDFIEDFLTDSNFNSLIFYVRTPYLISNELSILFNDVFTTEDNYYTQTYTGYYSFLDVSNSSKWQVFGTISNVNSLWFNLAYCNDYAVPSCTARYWDVYSANYASSDFTRSTLNNLYFTGVKMSNTSYTTLSTIGVFGYYYDPTHDSDTFYDLLFGVTDSGVYFIHSLLGFQLFGVDLFLALSSMLTLVVILALIKRFW